MAQMVDDEVIVANPQAFKHLFGKALLQRLASAISAVYPAFNKRRFMGLLSKLEALEMKPRVQLLRAELHKELPASYPQALGILLASRRSGKLTGFDLWPYSDFVQTYGLEHRTLSLQALKELTPFFTSEFAVRPYLKLYPDETLAFLEACAADPDVHVRRWASEGSRPRLPWGERLQEFVVEPGPTLVILERLKFDAELYVRKSVSNHLNDIAKDHPERVIKILRAWRKAAGSEHAAKVEWITHRALRGLIKAGHAAALKLIGVSREVQIKCSGFKMNQKAFKMGEAIGFELKIQSLANKPQKLVVDYIVHYVKANQKTAPKVFKLKNLELPAGGGVVIAKKHHLKHVTTRVHYPGRHFLEIQVNGQIVRRFAWDLLVE